MIAIVLLKSGCDMTGYKIIGHAGFDRAGKDIVCAAVSALGITCANALEKVAHIQPRIIQRDGYLSVQCIGKANYDHAAIILNTFRCGAVDIASSYPDNVSVIELNQCGGKAKC